MTLPFLQHRSIAINQAAQWETSFAATRQQVEISGNEQWRAGRAFCSTGLVTVYVRMKEQKNQDKTNVT